MSAGTRPGRDLNIGDWRSVAEVGFTEITSRVIAIRGERLALARFLVSAGDEQPVPFHNDVLGICEIDTENRIVASIMFDLDDIDAAFTELDARYVAGDASAYANVWSAITRAYAATSVRELPPTTPDWVNVDHRSGPSFASGDFPKYFNAAWDLASDVCIRIDAVHRLNDVGAVVSHTARGTSTGGFDAEWREVVLLAFEGNRISRFEMFDEADVDAALAQFDELRTQTPVLQNAASRLDQRFWAHFAARDWSAIAAIVDDDIRIDDRRRVVNAGVRHGREAHLEDLRAIAEVGPKDTISTVVATRGDRLVLTCVRSSHSGLEDSEVSAEVLCVVEVSTAGKIVTIVGFDIDDIDSAFAELDARYRDGEAATHAHIWSAVAGAYATLNSRQLPATTPDCVNIDHRRGIAYEGDVVPFVNATWDVSPDIAMRIEAVHRLTDLGAVVTWASYGTSQKGFKAEWRGLNILTVQGDLISHGEIFDEGDLDAAFARFDELSTPTSD